MSYSYKVHYFEDISSPDMVSTSFGHGGHLPAPAGGAVLGLAGQSHSSACSMTPLIEEMKLACLCRANNSSLRAADTGNRRPSFSSEMIFTTGKCPIHNLSVGCSILDYGMTMELFLSFSVGLRTGW